MANPKTHFAHCYHANESDNNDYWSATACGLEYTESPMSDRWADIDCKNCLRKQADIRRAELREFLETNLEANFINYL